MLKKLSILLWLSKVVTHLQSKAAKGDLKLHAFSEIADSG